MLFDNVSVSKVRIRIIFFAILYSKGAVYQDRLRTSIGKTQKEMLFLQYFDYTEETNGSKYYGHRRRVTYDDAETIATKYAAVLEAGVGGVGMWTADATHRDSAVDTAALAKEMWAVVRNATTAQLD